MKRVLKAFWVAFAAGCAIGITGALADDLIPSAYEWVLGVCMLASLWATCIAAAATGRPLIVQAPVAVGVSWGWMAAISLMGMHGEGVSIDWPAFFLCLIGLPLAIQATVSLGTWAWRRLRPKRDADASPAEGVRSGPRRLPGLWIICVLNGLGGMHSLATATTLTLPWAVLYGALAAADLGIAAGLFLRLRLVWVAAIILLGLGFAGNLVFGLQHAASNLTLIAITGMVTLAMGVYLWLRRRYFGGAAEQRPRVLSASGISALAVVLVLGGGFGLFMTVDEAPWSFPGLEAQAPTPPKEENGYFMLEQMGKKWPLQDDDQLQDVFDKMAGAGVAPSTEWLKAARAAVQKYQDCLAEGRELVKMPHFVEVTNIGGMARIGRPMEWLESSRDLAKLFAVSADLEGMDGHWGQALDDADRAIALGVLISKQSDCMIQDLVGVADMAIGMAFVRQVAGAVPDASLLKAHLGPLLPEEVLRTGHNLGVAGEFQADVGLIKGLSTMSSADIESQLGVKSLRIVPGYLAPHHVRSNPWLKVNMTTNIFGGQMQQMTIQPGTYVPVPPPPDPISTKGNRGILHRCLGYVLFARDPLGYTLSFMMLPAGERWVDQYYGTIARGRMTRLFLALRCYQLEHGKLPAKLDDLAPEYLKTVPLDPFTGKPFGYEPNGKQPRLWSVGPDGLTNPLPTQMESGGDDVRIFITFATKESGAADAGK